MNAPKHTPGPWTLGANPLMVMQRDSNYVIARAYERGTDAGDQSEANARLIAAAPDLLAVCDLLADTDSQPDRQLWLELRDRARAALAKANGGQP